MDRGPESAISFCSVCGTAIERNPHLAHIPQICPRCHTEGTVAILERHAHDGKGEIIGGCWEGNKIHVVTYLGDLGPSRRPASIERWPEKVFEVLSLSKKSENLATRWTFYASMLPAIQRIITYTGRVLTLYDRE
ncbi:hypothetical protein KKF84_21715 [Myxococcota bacterium]|nr:hypothetical protein [Myxococcota bacterium]